MILRLHRFLITATAVCVACATPVMVTREYAIRPPEVSAWMSSLEPPSELGSHFDIKAFFEFSGVPFPKGSDIRYDVPQQMLFVRNTPPNQRLIVAAMRDFRAKPIHAVEPTRAQSGARGSP